VTTGSRASYPPARQGDTRRAGVNFPAAVPAMPSRNRKPKKWTSRDYTLAAKKLRAAGFNVSLRSGKSADRYLKAAARRVWNQNKARVSAYTNPENRFVFKRSTPKQKRKLSRVASKEQTTPRGVFLQFPKGIDRKDAKFKVRGDVLEIETKKRRDVIVRIDPEQLAVDPEQAIRDAIGNRKPGKISLMVNGFRGKTEYPLKLFFRYFAGPGLEGDAPLIDQLRDDDRRGGGLDDEQIADIFSLRLIYGKRGSEMSRKKAARKPAKKAARKPAKKTARKAAKKPKRKR
jgi:hypothetical protein